MISSAYTRTSILARHLGASKTFICQSTTGAMSTANRSPPLGKLDPETTTLFICDVQERFRDLISGYPAVIDTSRRMARAAEALGIPIIVTEQYPKALGHTVTELADIMPSGSLTVPKTRFSMIVPEVMAALEGEPRRRKILLVGIETHVCVLQTTIDLIEMGYEVHVLVDGVSSQRLTDRATALQRLSQTGAFLASSEMVLFQIMGDTSHPAFKAISALCKEKRPDQLPAV